MKRSNIVTACFVFMLAVIFTSCSTSVDIAKRQFSNGYYIHFASKKNINTPVQEVAARKSGTPAEEIEMQSKPAPASEQEKMTPVKEEGFPVVTASVDRKAVISSKRELKDALSSLEIVEPVKSRVKSGRSAYAHKKFEYEGNSMWMRGDAPAVLMILLCIFLPPIAVGIKSDWSGGKFWFALLLTILFYFPGMIYAFFVCFG